MTKGRNYDTISGIHSQAVEIRAVLSRWQRADHIRLHAGEMTAQEMRSVLAVLRAVSHEVAGCLPDAANGEPAR